jgi:hypothetical protein
VERSGMVRINFEPGELPSGLPAAEVFEAPDGDRLIFWTIAYGNALRNADGLLQSPAIYLD